MKTVKLAVLLFVAALFLVAAAFAQTDPGVQGGNRGTGAALASVQANSPAGILAFFQDGQTRFQTQEAVAGNGLGPRFNTNSCVSCHAQPAIGGSGPATNPEFTEVGNCSTGAVACNTTNSIPSFITKNGPTREVRFPFFFNSSGGADTTNPNGGVETLYTVSGRPDAGNCSLQQPSFAAAQNANNIIFRIPTPTFGAGLIENLDDSTLLNNRNNNLNNNFGVGGGFNHNGNDGTISRFGWKAQNKSLHIFAGEAYNVEMGISNLLFPQDRPLPGEDGNGNTGGTGFPSSCLNLGGNGYPEDTNNPGSSGAAILDDVSAFANFMRTLAPPPTGTVILNGVPVSSTTIATGRSLFISVGCATCHNTSPGNTQKSNITSSLSNAPVNAFSDIEIHHMGSVLADNVGQGGAGGDQFRTAPLWGLGQRIFLLHDGRCTDLLCAIEAHDSSGGEAQNSELTFDNNLTASQQQAVLDFLRSL
jgi:CxxC motif-containing protein (DUF1111 family)